MMHLPMSIICVTPLSDKQQAIRKMIILKMLQNSNNNHITFNENLGKKTRKVIAFD